MTQEQAQIVALGLLRALERESGLDLVFVEEATEKTRLGWVFRYQTRQYVATGEIAWMLGGNSPILVDDNTGEAIKMGTAFTLEHNLDEYERTRARKPEPA